MRSLVCCIAAAAVLTVANAAKDVTAAGTIYHQRFTAAPVTRKGALVPLSRNAPCIATRGDGTMAHCGFTDGDLVTAGVVDTNPPCVFFDDTNCESPVKQVTVDLGASNEVGDIRARCTCQLAGSPDATTWHNLPSSGTFGGQQLRYVRVSGESLATIPESRCGRRGPTTARASGCCRGGAMAGLGTPVTARPPGHPRVSSSLPWAC